MYRVVRWTLVNGGYVRSSVLGQSDFTTTTLRGVSATSLNQPRGVHVDDNGTLWVADIGNNRVLWWTNAAQQANGAAASGVLGQSDLVTNTVAATTTLATTNSPWDVYVDKDGTLFVGDGGNNRYLVGFLFCFSCSLTRS